MSTDPDSHTVTLAGHEFAVPCQAGKSQPCPCEAKWALWMSHTHGDCNVTSTICNMHKMLVEAVIAATFANVPRDIPCRPCPKCGEMASPRVEDNVRWIPL